MCMALAICNYFKSMLDTRISTCIGLLSIGFLKLEEYFHKHRYTFKNFSKMNVISTTLMVYFRKIRTQYLDTYSI